MPKTANNGDLAYCKLVIDTAKEMARKSLTVATWGNISARDPKTGNIYITPSGFDYQKAKPEDVVVFNAKGVRIKGLRKPSIEKDLHIELYQAREDINAIIHTHALYTIAVGVAGINLPAVTEEFAQVFGKEAPLCRYAIPGSPNLAKYVVEAFGKDHFGVLMPSHGATVGAGDMSMALKLCDVIERNAQVLILAKSLGTEIRSIPQDDVDHIRGLHVLVETCGHVSRDKLARISACVDAIYYDVKHIDTNRHRALTGQGNELILHNLFWLSQHFQGDLSVRYPYIPGCNDREEDIDGFFQMMQGIRAKEVVFLPYHRLGLDKYQGLGREYAMGDLPSLRKQDLAFLSQRGQWFGLPVRIQ